MWSAVEFVFKKIYEICNFIRLAKPEQICEESWWDIRKQLREISDSNTVNKTLSPLNGLLNFVPHTDKSLYDLT